MCRRGLQHKAAVAAEAKPKERGNVTAAQGGDEETSMQPPDRAKFDATIGEIQKTIEDLKAQQAAVGAKIREYSGGKDEFFAMRSEYCTHLDEFTTKIDELMAGKEQIKMAIKKKKQEAKLQMQRNSTAAAIHDRLALVEFWLRTETMTLNQEKACMKEIEVLKRSRSKLGQEAKTHSLVSQDGDVDLSESIATIDNELAFYRNGKRQASQGLAELKRSRKEQLDDLTKYTEERDRLEKMIKTEVEKRRTLTDEFRWKVWDFNVWRSQQREARQNKINEERQAQQAEWDMIQRRKKAEISDRQPHVSEIALLEQTIVFCENADMYCVRKKGAGAKPIKHNIQTFKLFSRLELSPPMTTADIPETLERLQAQLDFYRDKVKAWEDGRSLLDQKVV